MISDEIYDSAIYRAYLSAGYSQDFSWAKAREAAEERRAGAAKLAPSEMSQANQALIMLGIAAILNGWQGQGYGAALASLLRERAGPDQEAEIKKALYQERELAGR